MRLRAAMALVAVLAAPSLLLADPAPANAPVASPPAVAQAAPDQQGENTPAEPDADDTLPIPPVPPRIAEGPQYEACLGMLDSDPSGADAMAATLAATAGSEAALHCHALAQVELGNTEEGATLLDKLAATSHAPAAFRAVVYGQADQAWTMSGRAEHAFDSASHAIALSPDDPDLLIGHAIAALALRHFEDAVADLDHALELDPKREDALVLRATSWRNLGHLDRARADIDAAMALDPDDPDGLLERGIVRQRQGDLAGAQADWERAADLGADTPTGDLAQQNLALLQAGPAR